MYKVQYTLSCLRYSIELYRVDSQGELAMEVLRIVVRRVNEVSSLLKRINKAWNKKCKKWKNCS